MTDGVVSTSESTFIREKKSGSFRFKGKSLFITIKTHVGIEYIDFINDMHPIDKWIYCNEKGDNKDTPYDHTHVAITFKNVVDTKSERHFDFEGIHPHLGSIRNWTAAVKYCLKEGVYEHNLPDIHKYRGMGALVERIVSHNNAIEALKDCAEKLSDVMPIITIYNQKGFMIPADLLEERKNMTLKPWQAQILNRIEESTNKRRDIFWVYDPIGNTGKTELCDHVEAKYTGECLIVAATGSLRDIADVIRNWMELGNVPKYVFIDLPRTYEDRDSIYTILESVKNGRLTATKYKGANVNFRSPHVCVFSNFKPDVSKCSRDRWKLYEIIKQDNEETLIPMTMH